MRQLTSSTTGGRPCALVLSIVFSLTIRFVDCDDESILTREFNTAYPAICDREYRTKYFNTQEHREGVRVGTLFIEPEYPPEDVQSITVNFHDKAYSENSLISNYDYASEFLPIDLVYEPSEYMIYEENETPEFMDAEDSTSQLIFAMRRLSEPPARNFNDTSDLYDIEKKLLPKGRYLRDFRNRKLRKMKRNIIPRTKLIDSKIAGGLFERKIRSLESRRRNMRRNSLNFDKKNNRDYFYKMMDTFGPMYDGRRGGKDDFKTAVSEAQWSQDNCKSLRRIVRGYSVNSAEVLPYMAFVDTGCGGAIISEMWVLTAGHCVDEDDPTYVHVGSIKLMTGCQYNVIHIYIHPHFTRQTLEFDVALLKVNPTFVFSPAIKPIAMSSVRALRKTCGVVAGWGAEEYKGAPRIMLSMTTIPIVARKKCRRFGITQSQFCAGYDDASSDTCQGDSGGPFVVRGVLMGIVSFGYKCARPHTPGVYVDVSYHRDWIRSITGF